MTSHFTVKSDLSHHKIHKQVFKFCIFISRLRIITTQTIEKMFDDVDIRM